MFSVNIYLETETKGIREGKGYYAYLLEYIKIDGDPVSRQEIEPEVKITPNRLILIAAYNALERLTKPCQITIHTDSSYLKSGLETWIHQWYQVDWIASNGGYVKNKDLWKALHEASRNHLVNVETTKVHEYSMYLKDEIKRRERKDIEEERIKAENVIESENAIKDQNTLKSPYELEV